MKTHLLILGAVLVLTGPSRAVTIPIGSLTNGAPPVDADFSVSVQTGTTVKVTNAQMKAYILNGKSTNSAAADYASTAGTATSAGTATYATASGTSTNAGYAATAGYATASGTSTNAGYAATAGTATHATYYDGVLAGDVSGPTTNTIVGSSMHVPSNNFPPFVLQTNAIGSTVDASGAAASAQAFAVQRANQTGTQPASTVTGLTPAATNSTAYLQPTNNLSDVQSSVSSAANLGLPTLIGPPGMNLLCLGDSITQGVNGNGAGAPQNFEAVLQAGPWGAGGSLVYNFAFAAETTGELASQYNGRNLTYVNCGVISGNTTVTVQSTSAGVSQPITLISQYMPVIGTGIPTGAYIASPVTGYGTTSASFTLSVAPTASSAAVTSSGGVYSGGQFLGFSGPITTTLSTTTNSTTATAPVANGIGAYMSIGSVGLAQNTTVTAASVSSGTTTLTLSQPAIATLTNSPAHASLAPTGIHFGGLSAGGVANGWFNFNGYPHLLSYALTGKPTLVSILLGQNDFLEKTSAVFTVTGTLTNGSNQVTALTGSYATIAHGNIITGTGLPTLNQALYVVSGAGTTTVTLSAPYTGTTGSYTLTVHVPTTQMDTWVSSYQGLVSTLHADGDTVANGGGVIADWITAAGDSSRTGISEAFRNQFNAVIAGGTLGQDYTFNGTTYFPSDTALASMGGVPYMNIADDLHFSAVGASLYGQQLSQFLLNLTKAKNLGGWAVPGIGSLLGNSRTIYVSPNYGSDVRAGDPHSFLYPFQTVAAAMAAATPMSGDNLLALDGPIIDNTTITLKNGVNINLGGATWAYQFIVTDNGSPVTMTLTGNGQTLSCGVNTVNWSLTGAGSSITVNDLNIVSQNYFCFFCGASGVGLTFNGCNLSGGAYSIYENNASDTLNFYGGGKLTGQVLAYGASPYIDGTIVGNSSSTPALTWAGSGTCTVTGSISNPTGQAVQANSSSGALNIGALIEGTTASALSNASSVTIRSPVVGSTSVSGSTSGAATFCESVITPNYKRVVIQLAALNGTASKTFPIAFTSTPIVVNSDAAVTSVSATAVTVTGSATTRTIVLEGN